MNAKSFILVLLTLLFTFPLAEAASPPRDRRLAVKFFVDENYLIAHTLRRGTSHGLHSKDVLNFQNLAWSLDRPSYKKLQAWKKGNPRELIEKSIREFSEFFLKLKKTELFKKILDQTDEYLKKSEAEWKKNFVDSYDFMERLTGFNFEGNVTIWITHPAVGNGQTWDQAKKEISFGAWPKFDNYFTVYIWHEILHLYLPFDRHAHAIIQLATDSELRRHLNQTSYPPFEGHAELFSEMNRLLPAWNEYLKKPDGLQKFYDRTKAK